MEEELASYGLAAHQIRWLSNNDLDMSDGRHRFKVQDVVVKIRSTATTKRVQWLSAIKRKWKSTGSILHISWECQRSIMNLLRKIHRGDHRPRSGCPMHIALHDEYLHGVLRHAMPVPGNRGRSSFLPSPQLDASHPDGDFQRIGFPRKGLPLESHNRLLYNVRYP